jgi:hypothetical protein
MEFQEPFKSLSYVLKIYGLWGEIGTRHKICASIYYILLFFGGVLGVVVKFQDHEKDKFLENLLLTPVYYTLCSFILIFLMTRRKIEKCVKKFNDTLCDDISFKSYINRACNHVKHTFRLKVLLTIIVIMFLVISPLFIGRLIVLMWEPMEWKGSKFYFYFMWIYQSFLFTTGTVLFFCFQQFHLLLVSLKEQYFNYFSDRSFSTNNRRKLRYRFRNHLW